MRTCGQLVEILEAYLEEKKISRRQFCALVDIPTSTIASWKAKNVLPSIELVAKLARFMNVSLDWLVYGENPEQHYAKIPMKICIAEKVFCTELKRCFGKTMMTMIMILNRFMKNI